MVTVTLSYEEVRMVIAAIDCKIAALRARAHGLRRSEEMRKFASIMDRQIPEYEQIKNMLLTGEEWPYTEGD